MSTKPTFTMLWIFLLLTLNVFSQAPQKFNYQAVVRDDAGNIVPDQSVGIRISILQEAVDGTVVYSETHSPTTNAYGLVTLDVGEGATTDDFTSIYWGDNTYYMKVEMDPAGGTAYSEMGTTQLLSVPYALFASAVDTPLTKLGIIEDALANPEDALFEVKRKDGQTVFAVYNEGIRAYVDDSGTKGPRGGFAIGGIKPGKGVTNEFLRVTPDSVRVYIDDNPSTKGTKGGFAIGGFSPGKGLTGDYLNVSGKESAEIIDPSEPRVLWYPNKEAFRTGLVLIADSADVGKNSLATGYESQAKGDWSQALGYKAIAIGDYSTAIGKDAVANDTSSFAFGNEAIAKGVNSFAFGQWAKADSAESYAFGRGAIADGYRSFAFGSAGIDSAGVETGVAHAIGDYSFAIGQGSIASGTGSFSLGLADTASGDYSMALGNKTKAIGKYSTAMGHKTEAYRWYSVAMGAATKASGTYSTAMGNRTTASANSSTAMGDFTTASGFGSTAMGGHTRASGDYSTAMGQNTIASGSASLAIGREIEANGSYSIAIALNDQNGTIVTQNNTMSIMGGKVGIGTTSPTEHLTVTGGISASDYVLALGGVHVGGTSDPGTNNLRVDKNVGIGTGSYGGGSRLLAISNGTVPTSSITDGVILYAEDVFSFQGYNSELKVRDELGNVTTLSPHNFSLITKSEPMAWSFYSENHNIGQKINVDMLKAVRLIEQLSGEKLVYIEDFDGNPIDYTSPEYPVKNITYSQFTEDVLNTIEEQQRIIEELKQEIEKLKNQ